MRRDIVVTLAASAALAGAMLVPLHAQLPFTTQKASGQIGDARYRRLVPQPGRHIHMSFGYFNRNTDGDRRGSDRSATTS